MVLFTHQRLITMREMVDCCAESFRYATQKENVNYNRHINLNCVAAGNYCMTSESRRRILNSFGHGC